MTRTWSAPTRGGVWVLLLGVVALVCAGPVPSQAGENDRVRRVFSIGADEITESSSLVVSSTHDGLVYTMNDSGDAATIYVLDDGNGELLARTSLAGVDAVDAEAMSAGTDGSLVVGDIGDNLAARETVSVYRLEEPIGVDQSITPRRVELRYADGPRDAEAMLYDAKSGRVYVVSKEFTGAAVYRSPRDVFDRDRAVLRPAAPGPALATDATWIPGTDLAVIRGYVGATVYRHPGWEKVQSFPLPDQPQGESIAAPSGGDVVWVGTEGANSSVLSVPLPDIPAQREPTQPEPTPPSADDPGSGEARTEERLDLAEMVVLAAAVALAVVVMVGVAAFIRHHR